MSVADISLSETVAQYVTGDTNGDELWHSLSSGARSSLAIVII